MTGKKGWIWLLFASVAMVVSVILGGCGSAVYADGTYEGKSPVYEGDEDGNGDGYGEVSITIQDNRIVACEFHTYQPDGTLKDEDYGKQDGEIANADFYNKAQRAVLACRKYAEQLAQTGELSGVTAITGASISHNEFQDAVKDALRKAQQ